MPQNETHAHETHAHETRAMRQSRKDASLLLFEPLPDFGSAPDILAGLTPREIERLAAAGFNVDFREGTPLFSQGDTHGGIFILRAGIVRTFYSAPNGREITLANWTPGNFVGGPDIFGDAPHVWSGKGVMAGHAIRLPGSVIQRMMIEIPNFAVGLVQALAFKGKCYSALLQMLGTRSVVERLAQLLINLTRLTGVESDGVVLIARMPSHDELATMVGATRQWVSVTLEKFRKRGLIEISGRRLIVRDLRPLSSIAGGD